MTKCEDKAHPSNRAVQEWICRQNIETFRRRLAEANDDSLRATLSELLAQEEANLDRLFEQAESLQWTKSQG